MKANAKSSVTLMAKDVRRLKRLKDRLKLKSNVAVIREGLRLLEEIHDREVLRQKFRQASLATRESLREELKELDHLASEGITSA